MAKPNTGEDGWELYNPDVPEGVVPLPDTTVETVDTDWAPYTGEEEEEQPPKKITKKNPVTGDIITATRPETPDLDAPSKQEVIEGMEPGPLRDAAQSNVDTQEYVNVTPQVPDPRQEVKDEIEEQKDAFTYAKPVRDDQGNLIDYQTEVGLPERSWVERFVASMKHAGANSLETGHPIRQAFEMGWADFGMDDWGRQNVEGWDKDPERQAYFRKAIMKQTMQRWNAQESAYKEQHGDTFSSAGNFMADVLGGIVGGAGPSMFIGGPGAKAVSGYAKSAALRSVDELAERVVTQAVIGGAFDVAEQNIDIAKGIEAEYQFSRTLMSAGFSAGGAAGIAGLGKGFQVLLRDGIASYGMTPKGQAYVILNDPKTGKARKHFLEEDGTVRDGGEVEAVSRPENGGLTDDEKATVGVMALNGVDLDTANSVIAHTGETITASSWEGFRQFQELNPENRAVTFEKSQVADQTAGLVQSKPAAEPAPPSPLELTKDMEITVEGVPRGEVKAIQQMAAVEKINEITERWTNAPEFTVFQSLDEVPFTHPQMKNQMMRYMDQGYRPMGWFDPETGKISIIADHIADEAELTRTVFHEALGHYGMDQRWQDKLNQGLRNLYAGNEKIRAEADRRLEADPDEFKGDGNALLRHVEEILAEESEAGPVNMSAFQELKAETKFLAAQMGLKRAAEFTDDDVLALLSMNHAKVIRGTRVDLYNGGSGGRVIARPMTQKEREDYQDELRKQVGKNREAGRLTESGEPVEVAPYAGGTIYGHGAPHEARFNNFDVVTHAGSGEGGQAFDFGLYAAEDVQVSQAVYREGLLPEWAFRRTEDGEFMIRAAMNDEPVTIDQYTERWGSIRNDPLSIPILSGASTRKAPVSELFREAVTTRGRKLSERRYNASAVELRDIWVAARKERNKYEKWVKEETDPYVRDLYEQKIDGLERVMDDVDDLDIYDRYLATESVWKTDPAGDPMIRIADDIYNREAGDISLDQYLREGWRKRSSAEAVEDAKNTGQDLREVERLRGFTQDDAFKVDDPDFRAELIDYAKTLDPESPRFREQSSMIDDLVDARREAYERTRDNPDDPALYAEYEKIRDRHSKFTEIERIVNEFDAIAKKDRGQLMLIESPKADPNFYLRDLTVGQQPPRVKEAFRKLGYDPDAPHIRDMKAGAFHEHVTKTKYGGSQKRAAIAWEEAGIDGNMHVNGNYRNKFERGEVPYGETQKNIVWFPKAASELKVVARFSKGGRHRPEFGSRTADAYDRATGGKKTPHAAHSMKDDKRIGSINVNKLESEFDVASRIRFNSQFYSVPKANKQAVTRAIADHMGLSLKEMRKMEIGVEPEMMVAARDTMMFHIDKAEELGAALIKEGKYPSEATVNNFLLNLAAAREAQEIVAGLASKASALLRSFNIEAKSLGADADIFRYMKDKQLDALDNPQKALAIAQKMAQFSGNKKAQARIVKDVFTPGIWDYVHSFRYNMMLSNPKTHLANIVGTSSNFAADTVAYGVASVLGQARRVLPGVNSNNRVSTREVLLRMWGPLHAVMEAQTWQNAVRSFKEGKPVHQVNRIEHNTAIMPKGLRGLEIPTRSLAAADEFFRSLFMRSEDYGMAARIALFEGRKGKDWIDRVSDMVDNPPREEIARLEKLAIEKGKRGEKLTDAEKADLVEAKKLDKIARQQAERLQFLDDPSKGTKWLEEWRKPNPKDDFTTRQLKNLTKLIFPFVRTPESLVRTANRYTPGIGMYDRYFKAGVKAGGGEMDVVIGRQIMALGFAAWAWNAAWEDDRLQGKISPNWQVVEEQKALGNYQDTFEIDGEQVPFRHLEPFAINLSVIGTVSDYLKRGIIDGKQSDELTYAAVAGLADAMMESTWLPAAEGLFSMIASNQEGIGGKAKQMFAGMASSFFNPAIVRQYNSMYGSRMRTNQTGAEGSLTDRFTGSIQGAWDTGVNPVRANNLGADVYSVDNTGTGWAIQKALGIPTNREPSEDPVFQEVARLSKTLGNKPVLSNIERKNVLKTSTGVKRDLTDYQYEEYVRRTGRKTRDYLAALITTDAWASLSDREKIAEIRDVQKDMKKYAFEETLQNAENAAMLEGGDDSGWELYTGE